MSRGARWLLLAVGLTLYAALGWYLAVFILGTGAFAWLALLGLPALLTAGTAALLRASVGEVVWTAVLSSALSGVALFAAIVWAGSQGAFQ